MLKREVNGDRCSFAGLVSQAKSARRARSIAVVILLCLANAAAAADTVEFLSGARVEGKVQKIRKVEKQIDFEVSIAGRAFNRTYSYDQIHAVTMKGKRYVLNEKGAGAPAESSTSGAGAADDDDAPDEAARRTPAQVKTFTDQQGRKAPDWYDSTPLEFPQSLDLDWPMPPPKPWNNQKNVGQYVWDVVNPNPGRWRGGIRLMHHLLELHNSNDELRTRIMKSIGGMYFRFFQDYPRAAFWWQQARVRKGDPDSIALAECYWRLGSKQMAVQMIDQKTLRLNMIKLYGDMGDTRKALQIADVFVRHNQEPHAAELFAADALRLAGQTENATRYYQKVLDRPAVGQRKERNETLQKRARASLEAIRLFDTSDVRKVADGAYKSQSIGYSGDVHVEVVVKYQRIESVEVTQHQERQFYSALDDTPSQIIAKQGVKGVDATSRATITSEAIINAAAKALASGAQ